MAVKSSHFDVLLTFDLDAESWLPDTLFSRSKGQFGPKVGLPRILRILDKYSIKSTFFVPGWVAETYPDSVNNILRKGHEVAAHGYKHENLFELKSEEKETEIIRQSVSSLEALIGRAPVGFRAPFGELSPYTMRNLQKFGFRYDSSLLDHEIPYLIKRDDQLTGMVELPESWPCDDWDIYEVERRSASEVFKVWLETFNSLYTAKSYFNSVMHPEVSGRASRAQMLEDLVRAMKRKRFVRFRRCIDVADEVIASG